MNPTNDPTLKSFIPVKNDSDFPIQNLPYGVFKRATKDRPHIGVAIGSFVLDLTVLEESGLLKVNNSPDVFAQTTLNQFMALGKSVWQQVRADISELLQDQNATLRDNSTLRSQVLIPMDQVEMLMPVEIGDYTDFYSSREHATNVGTMFRGKENALMPNWLHLPVAYHGRASSVIVSGNDVLRPVGQRTGKQENSPEFGPSVAVDFELEMGFLIGTGNQLGEPISVQNAIDHVFGMVIVNDWSARDIQKWEYQPLGPFLAKNFATSISPWVVTMEALHPFQTARPVQDPQPLDYLRKENDQALDINLEVHLQQQSMANSERVSRSNMKHLYWTISQQIAHHTITGCNLRTGDLLATGTISGPVPESAGSLLELTKAGKEPLVFSGGETQAYLQDNELVQMTAWAEADYRIGFGAVSARLLPPRPALKFP